MEASNYNQLKFEKQTQTVKKKWASPELMIIDARAQINGGPINTLKESQVTPTLGISHGSHS
jgi:hypothetical protein